MRDALNELDKTQIKFICDECGISQDELFSMDEDSIYDEVYDAMCDIEMAETPSTNEPLSEHCQIAVDIVTILGNALADEQGLCDEPDEND